VGSGTGGMLELLSGFGEVEAIEGSEEAIALCRERYGERIPIHQGQLPEAIPADRRFDLIAAFDVIEHLDDPVAALQAMRAALTGQGRVMITVPAFQFLWSEHDEVNHHRRRYTRAMLVDQFEDAGLTLEYASYFNSTLFAPIAALRLAQKFLPRRNAAAPQSDFAEAPALLNAALAGLFGAERHLVTRLPLPFGVSLLALAR
jgi:SAM-dependent methyltransferase